MITSTILRYLGIQITWYRYKSGRVYEFIYRNCQISGKVFRLYLIYQDIRVLKRVYRSKDNTNKADLDTIALVKELDSLPLALSIVGVYLEHIITSFSDYLQLYKIL
ncbi:Tetratricopeptide-like helical protein [Rutstroemia sp. NJR-2017a WRK4]|nr:Tetratricopeptide-like helical protein [Rutstroemia sp. NJR-2017a WRK4]